MREKCIQGMQAASIHSFIYPTDMHWAPTKWLALCWTVGDMVESRQPESLPSQNG